jgi:triphosphoribosyl-dephospho-CoA synthase
MTRTDTEEAPARVLTASDITVAAQLACLLEVSAAKPGNVSPGRHFVDLRYEDFLVSAVAIGEPLAGAGTRPLGATIRLAIEATARWTRSNTNLGIVLLLAPLAKAALNGVGGHLMRTPAEDAVRVSSLNDPRPHFDFRNAVARVLDATDVQDARDVYAAIRLASPGGLGGAESQDVAADPSVALVEAMRLAAHRDGVAREYATAFETTFGLGVPVLEQARQDGLPWEDAVVETFLKLLAHAPDTHIARRGGDAVARAVSDQAQRALEAGGVRSAAGRRAIDEMDRSLRDAEPPSPEAARKPNLGNPGTAADLTAAAIFVELLCERSSGSARIGGDHAASR